MPDQLRCYSPVDGKQYVQRSYCSDEELIAAVRNARAAQQDWQSMPLEQRLGLLDKVLDYFDEHRSLIAEQITWQMGRPSRYAEGEINGVLERGRHMLAIAPEALANVQPSNDSALNSASEQGIDHYIELTPVGLVLTVAPWNYPLLTTVNSVIPALAAGNGVLLKPSAQTPLAGEHFQRACAQAGLPKGLLQCVHLRHEQSSRLLSEGLVDFASFTGSVQAGAEFERSAAGQFLGLGLELGGKDPAYVRADLTAEQLEEAAVALADGAFFNSGQSCCGIERIYVAETYYERFCERFVQEVSQLKLGSPIELETSLGPLVRPAAANWVREQIQQAVEQGAKAWIDGSEYPLDDGEGAYLAPQVLTDVNHSMSVMSEESFGPVVGIMPVSSDEQAIELMNDSDYGLSASIWTRDKDAAQLIGQQIQTGTVFMNRCDYLDPALAWTGVKQTGRGVSLSSLGYAQLTQAKSFHLRLD
ncbi:aldehyde dehydrogenase family protein [Pseudoteredinibacter isoporae]|uniref:Acyl-CoA reductase-like NAD-dependent aldehyde dehydrogenase n=1 Tax=Pseudoteredinibacter isoporae TaxID=570281 RepID=A0A7X0JU50_9GAMM|nr:aldehyde dehydrogenase family protein [Pseudoteredinibacter isoporae]MBB6522313.1 acyl-CoA reductase-like NAD-dependent aldehyde dehydrogenase [Pseudoteredinibacter isoporae]NHO87846.1 aldehyde dehydrogenase family protein [Pseudoteredinibacter isoporae]NIB23823.1 aldehyde dehydrogenase family protein [Pseudoteredinibacter isoporae]